MTFPHKFLKDQQGQDLIEYVLLLAFVACASLGLFMGSGGFAAAHPTGGILLFLAKLGPKEGPAGFGTSLLIQGFLWILGGVGLVMFLSRARRNRAVNQLRRR